MDESIKKINAADIKQFESSELVETINHRPLTNNEFTCVRDYLVVTAVYENGSRPGPLENAKMKRLE